MQKHLFTAIISLLLCLALLPATSLAQGNGNGKGKGHNKHAQQDDDDSASNDNSGQNATGDFSFSTKQRGIIRGYYHDQYANLPPGLAKRHGDLPPGLQKQLQKNGTLPPGLQKRVKPFPQELEQQLPPLPPTYYRVTFNFDVMILDRRTQRIIDIVHDLLQP